MKQAARQAAEELVARFEAAGAARIEADVLQPADLLLDLYGEDIRARAYTTTDPLRGEQMLRPDFTVPVVQHHMGVSAEPARYTYTGEVFRRQEVDEARPNEHLQVGFEVFDRSNPAEVEAEVFALFADAVAGLGLRAVTGDIGILIAAVAGLPISEARRAALTRHIWRPDRFRALLDRFAAPRDVVLAETIGPEIGVRSRAEVDARVAALEADAREPLLDTGLVTRLGDLLDVADGAEASLATLRALEVDLPAIAPALDRLEARHEALAARGIDLATLHFEASYGRTLMEYYDGFVFGLLVPDTKLPPVATGGRYDALTQALGRGTGVPAVGGVLRPEMILDLRGGGDA